MTRPRQRGAARAAAVRDDDREAGEPRRRRPAAGLPLAARGSGPSSASPPRRPQAGRERRAAGARADDDALRGQRRGGRGAGGAEGGLHGLPGDRRVAPVGTATRPGTRGCVSTTARSSHGSRARIRPCSTPRPGRDLQRVRAPEACAPSSRSARAPRRSRRPALRCADAADAGVEADDAEIGRAPPGPSARRHALGRRDCSRRAGGIVARPAAAGEPAAPPSRRRAPSPGMPPAGDAHVRVAPFPSDSADPNHGPGRLTGRTLRPDSGPTDGGGSVAQEGARRRVKRILEAPQSRS